MAAPTNTFKSTDMRGIREDLSDVIYDISPDETPFHSTCGRGRASNTNHEWQTDALRSSADNAHLEGDDTVVEARTATTRLGNQCQIFKNSVSIPGTDRGLRKAGRAKEMAYQLGKVMKEHKLDIERALFANQAKVTRSGVVAGRLAGVPAWLTTNTVHESGSSGADPTGDGTDARTDDGTPVAFSQSRLDTVLQSRWDEGGKKTGVSVYLSSGQMNVALGFVGNNNQRAQLQASEGRVINNMMVYVTPWGDVKFVMARENRERDVLVLQDDMWSVAYLRPSRTEALAKTGDSEKRQIVTELTLCSKNEKASGGVFDNS